MFNRIVELCAQRGITVAELERELGFGKCTITKWKKSSASVVNAKKVANYFGVSIEYLLEQNSTSEKGI